EIFLRKTGDGGKERKKGPKTRRPVETDAADGNPPRTRIPTAAWKAQNASHSFHQALRRRRDLYLELQSGHFTCYKKRTSSRANNTLGWLGWLAAQTVYA